MAEHKKDERFAHILSDPKLQRIKLKEQKTKVDKRFQSLIANSKSKQRCLIDKRGRPLTATSRSGLSQFYDLSDSEEESMCEEVIHCKGKKEKTHHTEYKDKEEKQEKVIKEEAILNEKPDDEEQTDEERVMELVVEEEGEEDEDETEDDGESEDEDDDECTDGEDDDEEEDEDKSSLIRNKKNRKKTDDISPDYSRGIGNISSSSDEEEEDDDDQEFSGEEVEDSPAKGLVASIHPWAEMLEKEVPVVEQSTRRLAICNMNWDYVTAQDLMMLCNSFKPQHGTVFSVMIYPTDFGMERMMEENKKGPKEITEGKESTASSTTENTAKTDVEEKESTTCTTKKKAKKGTEEKKSAKNKDEKNSEKVRLYELNRLRYFIAVVECDSVETADQIYTNCDGVEFEKSGTKLDLRYIPDGETFDYEPKNVATSLPASGTYKPPHFVDAALSKTDVKLSWDRTSHRRLATTQMDFRKVKNIDDLEEQFQEYIAPYMSDEDEEDEEDPYPNLDWSYTPGQRPTKRDVQEMKSTLLTVKDEEKAEEEEMEEEAKEAEVEEEPKSDEDQVHMEFMWDLGLKDSLEDVAKQKRKEIETAKMTPWEQYQKKTREKKRQKEREKKRNAKAGQQKESHKLQENSVELDSFFLPDDSSDEEEGKPKRRKESLKKRAKKRRREAEEQRLEVDQAVLADPRFADLAKKDFALDPSAPEFHKRRKKF